MISFREPYTMPIQRRDGGASRVGGLGGCWLEASEKCEGVRPVGHVTTLGYVVLAGAPVVGLVGGYLLETPIIGFVVGAMVGTINVFDGSGLWFGLRTTYCCRRIPGPDNSYRTSGWIEEVE